MTTDKIVWDSFCAQASRIMQELLAGKISLKKAIEFFENDPAISDGDLRERIENTLCEIGGSPGYYMELLELFRTDVTEAELIEHFNSGKTSLEQATRFFRTLFLRLKELFR